MAIHWDIGGRVTHNFKVQSWKECQNFQLYFMMGTVVNTNSSAEIAGEGVEIFMVGECKYVTHAKRMVFS